jgi:hypothetical protein
LLGFNVMSCVVGIFFSCRRVWNFKELEGRGFLGGGDLGFSEAWVGNFHSCREVNFQELFGGTFQELEHGNF